MLVDKGPMNPGYDDLPRGLIAPYDIHTMVSGLGVPAANSGRYCVVAVPRRRVVTRFWMYVFATAAGNYDVGIYTMSGASLSTRIWSKGLTPNPAVGWRDMADGGMGTGVELIPGVVYALWFANSVTTTTIGRTSLLTANLANTNLNSVDMPPTYILSGSKASVIGAASPLSATSPTISAPTAAADIIWIGLN